MRKSMFIMASLMAMSTIAFAAGAMKSGTKAAMQSAATPLNNVVKMDADGHRKALCCCRAEFTVTDNAPTMDHAGTTFYMCGEGCKEMAMKATREQTAVMIADWHEKYATYPVPTNTFVSDGKLWAKCGCGKEFELKDQSLAIIENGHASYCCSEACHEGFMKLSAAERLQKEMAILKANAEVKSTSR